MVFAYPPFDSSPNSPVTLAIIPRYNRVRMAVYLLGNIPGSQLPHDFSPALTKPAFYLQESDGQYLGRSLCAIGSSEFVYALPSKNLEKLNNTLSADADRKPRSPTGKKVCWFLSLYIRLHPLKSLFDQKHILTTFFLISPKTRQLKPSTLCQCQPSYKTATRARYSGSFKVATFSPTPRL